VGLQRSIPIIDSRSELSSIPSRQSHRSVDNHELSKEALTQEIYNTRSMLAAGGRSSIARENILSTSKRRRLEELVRSGFVQLK
jgi:hypothetical protein